jgi:nicotinate-nucleotide adenylyltransferase
MTIKKVGLYGGSFDPVHQGHLSAAETIYNNLNLDRVIFIPSYVAPHKLNGSVATAQQRHEMLSLVTSDYSFFEVSDYEIENEEVSYTVHTVDYFKRLYPQAHLYLLLGSDSLQHFPSWYALDQIFSLCSPVFFDRPGETDFEDCVEKSLLCTAYKQQVLEFYQRISTYPISSTEIRDALGQNQMNLEGLPQSVMDYIVDKHLYQR